MRNALGVFLLAAALAHVGAHLSLVVGLARARRWHDAAIAFVLTPLAPYWGWRSGMRRRALAWGGALALYAFGVAMLA